MQDALNHIFYRGYLMDVEDYFSYHFLEGITLTKDGILTKGKQQLYIPERTGVLLVLLEAAGTVVLKDNIIEKYGERLS